MKLFVTGVGGQLGYDVVNECAKRGYEVVGSDITPTYNGVNDDSAAASAQYVQLDITDKAAVEQIINDITIKEPPTYGYAMTIEEKKKKKSEKLRQKYLKRSIKRNKEVI